MKTKINQKVFPSLLKKIISLSLILIPSSLVASTLTIENHHTDEITTIIEPGIGQLMGGEEIKLKIPKGKHRQIDVAYTGFAPETEVITLTGKSGLLSSTCEHPIQINTNARIVFASTTPAGIKCIITK